MRTGMSHPLRIVKQRHKLSRPHRPRQANSPSGGRAGPAIALLQHSGRGIPQPQAVAEPDRPGVDMREVINDEEFRAGAERLGELNAFGIGNDRVVAAMYNDQRPWKAM